MKRNVGQNQIMGIYPSITNAIVITTGILAANNGRGVQISSGKAITNLGDSDGPLFDKYGAVIGVDSTGTADDPNLVTHSGFYVNLNHPSVAAFVRQQLASAPNESSPQKSSYYETSSPRADPNTANQPAAKAAPNAASADGQWRDSYNGNTYPYCASSASDPDGDGWGYENSKSCKVR
jgi:hypothetical protein